MKLPGECCIPFDDVADTFEGLVQSTFPELMHPSFDPEIFTVRAILTPKNEDVDSINQVLINQFPGQSAIYTSFDSVVDDNCSNYPLEFLNTLCPGGRNEPAQVGA